MKRPHLTSPDGSHFVFVESNFAGFKTKLAGAVWGEGGRRRKFIAMNSTGKLGEFRSAAAADEALIAAATEPNQ